MGLFDLFSHHIYLAKADFDVTGTFSRLFQMANNQQFVTKISAISVSTDNMSLLNSVYVTFY